jgi:hypothetical protein
MAQEVLLDLLGGEEKVAAQDVCNSDHENWEFHQPSNVRPGAMTLGGGQRWMAWEDVLHSPLPANRAEKALVSACVVFLFVQRAWLTLADPHVVRKVLNISCRHVEDMSGP